MADLGEQVNTIERALGECMIEHALTIVRGWLNELGENNPYEEAYKNLYGKYNDLFRHWLNVDDDEDSDELNNLTNEAYQLADAVYADIRLKRGLSPRMHGFNPNSPQSLINYFTNCIQLRKEDLEWLNATIHDPDKAATALLAISSLTHNLRECFSQEALMVLMDGFNAENELVADQCIANVLTLLIHYDIRMDFFPELQKAFVKAAGVSMDMCNHVFDVLLAVVRTSVYKGPKEGMTDQMPVSEIPAELQQLVQSAGLQEDDVTTYYNWVPKSEAEYLTGLLTIFPQTWLYEVLVEANPACAKSLAHAYLMIGNRNLMWDNPDIGESWFVQKLRWRKDNPLDYLNYAHCLMLKGDRMMAYEMYRQARKMYKSAKEFFNVFRPDRKQLIDHGVPMEFVYLMEDKLINA